MSSILDQLDREAALMMYVVGELSETDRKAFEARIGNDADLAEDVRRLRTAHASYLAGVRHADEHTRLPVTEAVALRRVSREMKQWQVDRVMRPMQIKRKTLPWWSYTGAAAVAVLVGVLVWTSTRPVGQISANPDVLRDQTQAQADEAALVEWMDGSLADAKVDKTAELTMSESDSLNSIFLTSPAEEN